MSWVSNKIIDLLSIIFVLDCTESRVIKKYFSNVLSESSFFSVRIFIWFFDSISLMSNGSEVKNIYEGGAGITICLR